MKKINVYWINDGCDGVISAKSFKQMIKYLSKCCGYSVEELKNILINENDISDYDCSDIDSKWLYIVEKLPKKEFCNKSKFIGMCD